MSQLAIAEAFALSGSFEEAGVLEEVCSSASQDVCRSASASVSVASSIPHVNLHFDVIPVSNNSMKGAQRRFALLPRWGR